MECQLQLDFRDGNDNWTFKYDANNNWTWKVALMTTRLWIPMTIGL